MEAPHLTRSEVDAWAAGPEEALFAQAEHLTATYAARTFDMCSIVNGKSGRCPEDCKWCAQSAHHATACEVHGLISAEECLRHARANEDAGIRRFSIVNSGRKPTAAELEGVCALIRLLRQETHLELCASLGLLGEADLRALAEAGVTRYHCNLEAAPAVFARLCSTHTQSEKVETLRAARRVGMEICSGGIIGMGESEAERIDLAFTLRDLFEEDPGATASIPINILSPIPGTPLADLPLLPERDILRTVALFRLVHPTAALRFAGGRARLSPATLDRALRLGINAAIEGDLLTTLGNTVAQDRTHILRAGYTL
ncbi:MAG: biotin synthase BioB [Candidatus Spyradenecus sp.]